MPVQDGYVWTKQDNDMNPDEIIGLIPAAGEGTRLGPLPCSKELTPVGLSRLEGALRPVPVCVPLLQNLRLAGVQSAFLVIREGKWDIPQYLGDGSRFDMRLGYLLRGLPYGPPYTLDQAYPFIRESLIAFGFPDILIRPDNVYVRLREHWDGSEADVVLGLFPAYDSDTMDMVALDDQRRVIEFVIKPAHTTLTYAWINALWGPTFTEFLHGYLGRISVPSQELSVGHVIQAAIDHGVRVEGLPFPEGAYLDIGTPEHLAQAQRHPKEWGLQ
jgi:glucose-1-phosphate thymidylyltransferase